MSVKCKIENAELNKKLVGDTITVSRVGKTHVDDNKIKKHITTKDLLIEFMNKQDKFNHNIITKFDSLENRFDNLETRITNAIRTNNLKE